MKRSTLPVTDKMEKTPAASAMDWSIRLEKSLRSRTPGKSIEALEEICSRLEWWNCESELKAAEYRMFGLIPGEDKLFLSAIFLRLVDAFRFGSKQIKNGVVKVFLGLMKRSGERCGEGILSNCKLDDYMESLRRVKGVFDDGDSEERALALALFGCWANFTKDSPDVRYIVLSSLVSPDVLEVKAALFAAGCLSELSDDFAIVFLEMLTTVVISSVVSRGIKLAAGRAFAKLWCSSLVAYKAYKTGVKLLTDSSVDDFSAVMLVSLTRIASRWMMLIPSQMELILLFLSEDRCMKMQATSLRCFRFILAKDICDFSLAADTVHKLFGLLNRSESPPTLQLEALKLLHKVFLFNISMIPCTGMTELFLKLLAVVENMEHSCIVPTRVLAVDTLADISAKLLGRQDVISGGIGLSLAIQVISFVLDQIFLLVTPKAGCYQPEFALEHEVKSLLRLLFNLAQKHSYVHSLLLNNICLFIDKLMKMLDKVRNVEKSGLANHETSEYNSHTESVFELKLMLYVSKILVACLQNLEDTSADTCQILDKLKLQIENVCHCSYFDSYTTMIYSLLLRFCATDIGMRHMAEKTIFLSSNLKRDIDSIFQLDEFTIDVAKMMLERNNYWSSYKAGKLAACQGAWSFAAFIFEQLSLVVQSASSSCWLKSLAQFSACEKQIQYFSLHDLGTLTAPPESNPDERGGISSKMNRCRNIENLLGACESLLSAEGLLAVPNMGHTFSFQRWFLTLRAKVLKNVVNVMKLLDNSSSILDGSGPSKRLERGILSPCSTSSHRLDYLINYSTEISYRMKKLAQEFDLLLTSVMDMDTQSRMIVSTLALSCSLIAFIAGFVFLRPNLHSSGNYKKFKCGNSAETFHALLIEDLVGRLRPIDVETRKNLLFLLKLLFPNYKSCSLPQLQTQISSSSYDSRALYELCANSVKGILTLQNDASKVQVDDGDSALQITGSRLLLNIISELMFIPFRTPYRFFRVRPLISSELFVMNEDGKSSKDGIYVLSGFHLSLSLCLQVKNIPAYTLSGSQRKAYCILNCEKYSHNKTTEIADCDDLGRKDQEEMVDMMMELNDKLLRYLVGDRERHCNADDCSMLDEYVNFQLNRRGQGFCDCLLDVSAFPVGCYRIKWHTGFVDSRGSYWSSFPLNSFLLFTVKEDTNSMQ